MSKERRPRSRARFNGRIGLIATAAVITLLAAARGGRTTHESSASTNLVPTLPGTNVPIQVDGSDIYAGSHELVEMLCLYKRTSGRVDIPTGSSAANTYAVQLAHPSVANFAIVYTGFGSGEEVVGLEHFTVQQAGTEVTMTSDQPESPGYSAPLTLSERIDILEGRTISGQSGMIDYQLSRIGGHLILGLFCDRAGTDDVIRQMLPHDTVDPGWRPSQPVSSPSLPNRFLP